MTIVILGIVAVPLSLLLSQHVESLFLSEDLVMARQLARCDMEKVNNLAFANIINANVTMYEGYPYDVGRSVSYSQGNATSPESLKKITVDVRRTQKAAVLTSLSTYIARNAAYGL